jgi:hypothetical protein
MYNWTLFFHQENVGNLGLREKTSAGNRRAFNCRVAQRRVVNFSLEFRILKFRIHEVENGTWILMPLKKRTPNALSKWHFRYSFIFETSSDIRIVNYQLKFTPDYMRN